MRWDRTWQPEYLFRCYGAVSYTHLDVYKRQITVYLGTKEWDGPRKLSDMFGEVDEELLPFIPDYRINPVSYTHLDVYKRQVYGLIAEIIVCLGYNKLYMEVKLPNGTVGQILDICLLYTSMSRLYPITSLSLRIYHRIRSVFLCSAEMVH